MKIKIKLYTLTIFVTFICVLNTFAQQKVEFYMGYSESFRALSYDKSDTGLQNIITLSADDAKVRSINGGIRYRIFDKKHLSFKTGIEVNALGFMDKVITNLRWPSEITPEGYVPDPTLPRRYLSGRKFIYIDLPLAIELKKSWGNWTPNIQLELVPQYLISVKHIKTLDIGTVTDFKKPDKNIHRFNLAAGLSLGTYYHINDTCALMINGYYRRQLLGIVDAPITATLYAFGCNAGISFNL